MFFTERMGLSAAVETTYGTDKVPTAALNAMLAQDVKITPLDGDEIERKHVRPGGSGAYEKELINKRVAISFGVRLRGAGAAGSIPAIDAVLRAVGWSGTNTAGVQHQYKLVDDNYESVTIYLNRGNSVNGVRHRIVGARGSYKLAFDTKNDPMITFDLIGLFLPVDATAMPTTFDFTGFTTVKIPAINKTNTTFTIGGYAAILEKLDIDGGVQVKHVPKVNYESVDITGRAVTGSMTVLEPTLAQQDFFASAYNTPDVLVFENGLVAGQIIRLDAARVQRGKPELTDVDGISALSMSTTFLPSDAGDSNDLILTFK